MENEEAPDELPPSPPGALLCNFKIEVVEIEEEADGTQGKTSQSVQLSDRSDRK